MWSVYILKCGDGTLYTGISKDVARRLAEHSEGGAKGAKYTRRRGPLELIYQREVGTHSEAAKEEIRIKRLTRKQKLALVSAHAELEA